MGAGLDELRQRLRGLESEARDLPWAAERRWSVQDHVFWEDGIVCVDLHDLNVRLGLQAVALAEDLAGDQGMENGAVRFVTGQGRHSPDGTSAMKEAVSERLYAIGQDRGWRFVPHGRGAFDLVVDETHAPATITHRLSPGCWVGIAAFCVAAVVAFPPALVLLPVAFGWGAWWWWKGRKIAGTPPLPRKPRNPRKRR